MVDIIQQVLSVLRMAKMKFVNIPFLSFCIVTIFLLNVGCNSRSSSSSSGNYLSRGSRATLEYYRIPGMVYIPTGAMLVGANDDGVYGNFFAQKNRQVTINGFWMDETETTNSMYRSFVEYTLDSNVAVALSLYAKSPAQQPQSAGRRRRGGNRNQNRRQAANARSTVQSGVARPSTSPAATANASTQKVTDSFLDLAMVRTALQDVKNLQKLREKQLFFYNRVRKSYVPNYDTIKYKYYAFSLAEFAHDGGSFSEEALNRHYKEESIRVIPDTTVWVTDFSYSYNEPMAIRYFSAANYSNYPVVGINWYQAKAYCDWRTEQTRNFIVQEFKKDQFSFDAYFRLPTESEWEYAARGARSASLYPWGGPYTSNKFGCFLANFKNQRGIYMEDGHAYTCDVTSYWPNDFGLYNMAGNVAEWTQSVYTNDAYVYMSDINPSLSAIDLNVIGNIAEEDKKELYRKKVIRGGSWKDVAAFIQNGHRTYQNADEAHSYTGFRTVIDLPPSSF